MNTYILDGNKSKITWKGKHDSTIKKGELRFSHGKLFTELGKVVEGFIGIDFSSLQVSDKDDLDKEDKEKFVNHLKSDEFLNTSKYPTAEYKIVDLVKESGETKVKGILNLKEEAYGLNFPIDINVEDKQVTAEANFDLSHINPLINDRINENYEGEPITGVELNFKLVADKQSL